ncbi:TPA: hypothetical protein ACVPL5_001128 [Yersinia enterocolitica]
MHNHSDYSDDVFHWIKTDYDGKDNKKADELAFEIMKKIVMDGCLNASGKDTFRNLESVCFTESPLEVKRHQSSRYTQFGFAFSKSLIFDLGGRHVIYQPKNEAHFLPEGLHWRHVTYDPNDKDKVKRSGVNFTWEREWRLNCKQLDIHNAHSVIVPNAFFADELSHFLHGWEHMNWAGWISGDSEARSPEEYEEHLIEIHDRIKIFEDI